MASADGTAWAPVEDPLLEDILAVYKPACRYLKLAFVDGTVRADDAPLARAKGVFEIPESIYIEDTGHLNSVELNIAYNQLVYVLFAQCIVNQTIPEMSHLTIGDYRERQLPDVLIHSFSARFKRSMDRKRFEGEVAITDAMNTEKFIRLDTRSTFWDAGDGSAKAEVALVIMNDRAAPSPGDSG